MVCKYYRFILDSSSFDNEGEDYGCHAVIQTDKGRIENYVEQTNQ